MKKNPKSLLKRHSPLFWGRTPLFFLLMLIAPVITWGNPPNPLSLFTEDLTQLTLEDLINIEVTSVSKKTQKLSEAAAAIFVITQEDIRRSGATCIPEALRMVPGLQVAKIDAIFSTEKRKSYLTGIKKADGILHRRPFLMSFQAPLILPAFFPDAPGR